MMRPPHVTCAVEMKTKEVCVWSAGAALVARDPWGRWQLVGPCLKYLTFVVNDIKISVKKNYCPEI